MHIFGAWRPLNVAFLLRWVYLARNNSIYSNPSNGPRVAVNMLSIWINDRSSVGCVPDALIHPAYRWNQSSLSVHADISQYVCDGAICLPVAVCLRWSNMFAPFFLTNIHDLECTSGPYHVMILTHRMRICVTSCNQNMICSMRVPLHCRRRCMPTRSAFLRLQKSISVMRSAQLTSSER